METIETLNKRIATTKELQSIVRTMKSLSAVSIRQYERAAEALRQYGRTIDLGLLVLLREAPLLGAESRQADGPTAAIVFGSDHGLCGHFNEQISSFTRSEMAKCAVPGEDNACLVIGIQAALRLEEMGLEADEVFQLPGSVGGLTETANSVLLKIDEWRTERGVARVLLFHNAPSPEEISSPERHQLLPIEATWLQQLAKRRWPSPVLPTYTMDRRALFSSLIREHLFVAIFRAGAESMASEHATRLASMQAAERNIQERLEEMEGAFRHRRQQAITEELLDIVGGFETLRAAEPSGRDAT